MSLKNKKNHPYLEAEFENENEYKGHIRMRPDYGACKKATSRRIASRVVRATVDGNRQRLLELDLRLAAEFRDQVVRSVIAQVRNVDPGAPYPPSAFYDGDMNIDIQVENHSTVHPAMLLQVKIPADLFYQFAFGTNKAGLYDAYANKEIPLEGLKVRGKAEDVAAQIISTLAEYVKKGGSPQASHSGLPMPLTK